MFCGKCGAQNSDDAKFCRECGNPLQSTNAPVTAAPAPAAGKVSYRTVGIIAVAAVALVVVLLVMGLFGGSKPEKQALKAVEAMFEPDFETIFELIPQDLLKEEMGADEEMLEDTIDWLDDLMKDTMDNVGVTKVKCKVGDSEKLSDEELEAIQENYEEYDLKVKAAQVVEVEVTVTAGDETESQTLMVTVVKIGGKWYLDFSSLDNMLMF